MGLKLYGLDTERQTLMIRQGKGAKERMVLVGERALDWADKYITDVRPGLVCEPDEGILFLTSEGQMFTANHLSHLVRKAIAAADIGKTGSCHLFASHHGHAHARGRWRRALYPGNARPRQPRNDAGSTPRFRFGSCERSTRRRTRARSEATTMLKAMGLMKND